MQRRFSRIAFLGASLSIVHAFGAQEVNSETYKLFTDSPLAKDSYTINFNNVSIIEYIRFVSKVGNLNFIFEEADLGFNVTIVSEDPISVKNIMSILVQILRVHDLALLEQDNNLLITKSKEVNQISTVVSADLPMPMHEVPLVTRVFRIKNASLGTIASVIKPLMSASAQVEVSNETRQLIVTDITTNVEKVDALLASIDAPHTPLDVESFLAKHVAPKDLISLAEKIVTPFAEGNPLIFVSQPETNTLFIVSTPYLIDRTMALLHDLDSPLHATASPSLEDQSVLLYKVEQRSLDDLLDILEEMAAQLQVPGSPPSRLYQTLASVKTLKDVNVLIFLGDVDTLARVKGILSTVDTAPTAGGKGTFYVYKIHVASEGQIERSLQQMVENLQKSSYPDQELIQAIQSVKWIQESNSLVFTGNEVALQRLAEILPTFDVGPKVAGSASTFFIYHPVARKGEDIYDAVQETGKNLEKAGLADPALLRAIGTMKWVESSNSLIFTGDAPSIEKVRDIVEKLDVTTTAPPSNFYLYKLEHAQGSVVEANLKKVAKNLAQGMHPNQGLIDTINSIKWIKESNSLMITGPELAIDEVKQLIAHFDVSGEVKAPKNVFYIYKPVHKTPDQIESAMKDIATDLEASGLIDPDLLLTIEGMRYASSTQSLVFTGTQESLDKVKDLLSRIDTTTGPLQIQQVGELTFFVYKLQHASPQLFMTSLRNFASALNKSNPVDTAVIESIDSMKWIQETNSILFTGPAAALQKIESLAQKFDTAELGGEAAVTTLTRAPQGFVLYKPRYQTGDELISILCDFEKHLMQSGVMDQGLFDAIGHLKWVDKMSALLISGDPESIKKVEDLLARFDIPQAKGEAAIESIEDTSFLIYKLQYHQGSDIQAALKEVASSLGKGPSGGNQALVGVINSLQWIQVTNSLLGTGDQNVLSRLKELIQNLDIPMRQVFIEVLIIETTLSNSQNFGLQWGGKLQYFSRVAGGTGNFPAADPNVGAIAGPSIQTPLSAISSTRTPNANTDIPFSTGFDFGVIGDIIMHKGKSFLSLGSLVNALQIDNDSTIVINPKIITQDNTNSTIFFGQNVPYTASVVTNQSSNTIQSNSLEYRNVGVNLSITPLIGNADIITLDIANELSAITNNISGSNGGVNGIQTTQSTMSTRVHVPDKHFLVLSGMIQDSKTHFRSSIPCLGGLPVIGFAFSENDRLDAKNNVLIFIRPHIIHSFDEYRQLTEHQEDIFREQAVLPVLKEEFDAGVDIVKSIEGS